MQEGTQPTIAVGQVFCRRSRQLSTALRVIFVTLAKVIAQVLKMRKVMDHVVAVV